MKNPKHFDQHRRFPKDFNWNAPLKLFLWMITTAIILIIAITLIGAVLSSCQKESSFTSRTIESDHGLKPPGGYSKTVREVTPELVMASKKTNPGKGKGKPQPPTDTTGSGGGDTTYNPPTSGVNVIYLDFDGETVSPQYWNAGTVNYSGMAAWEIDSVYTATRREYEPLGYTVTLDRKQYDAAPVGHRVMVIYTESWSWYGQAGGVAYVGSYKFDAPCFVFTSLLGYSPKYVSDAGIHEAGHTFGLHHVPDANSAYATYGNWMGAAYYVDKGFFEPWVKDATGNYVNQYTQIKSYL
jgi:hypothetical protein